VRFAAPHASFMWRLDAQSRRALFEDHASRRVAIKNAEGGRARLRL
jgi:hypothetical protein